MPQPQVEKLPNFILKVGRKDLDQEKIGLLSNLISRLYLVGVEDQANALNRIGVINVYLNQYDEALRAFQKSLSIEVCELTFSNYIQTLERLGKFKQAINEGLAYLESNPNNRKVFSGLIDIISKYPDVNTVNKILEYYKFQDEADVVTGMESEFRSTMQNELNILNMLKIDIDYFNLISNMAFIEVKKIQVGPVNFRSYLNEEIDHLNVNVIVSGADMKDIKILNSNFENHLNTLIDNKAISFETYIEHLPKFSFSFSVNNTSKIAA